MDSSPSTGESRLPRPFRQATFVLLVAFVAEAAVGSSGRWLVVGPLSIRMLLFLGCLGASVPLLWQERRYLLRQSMLWVTAAFLLALAASALWGRHLGNPPAFIASDLTAFSALLLTAPVLALRLTRTEVDRLGSVLFWSSVALAGATVVVHLLVPLHLVNVNELAQWLTERSLGGLADVGGGVQRIYLRSQVLFIPALLLGLQRLATADRSRMAYLTGASVVAMGLLLSLTRGLWLGVALALLVFFVWCARDVVRLLKNVALVLAGLSVLLALSSAAYRGPALVVAAVERLSPSLVVLLPTAQPSVGDATSTGAPSRPTPTATTPRVTVPPPMSSTGEDPDAAAVEIRSRTLALSKEKIRERPLTGWGLGYNLDEIRQDGRTEYMYWDLLMKLGAPGLVLFVVLYAWTPAHALIRRMTQEGVTPSAALAASVAGVAVTSYFNPFLNSTLGIVVLLMLVAATAATQARTSSWRA